MAGTAPGKRTFKINEIKTMLITFKINNNSDNKTNNDNSLCIYLSTYSHVGSCVLITVVRMTITFITNNKNNYDHNIHNNQQ